MPTHINLHKTGLRPSPRLNAENMQKSQSPRLIRRKGKINNAWAIHLLEYPWSVHHDITREWYFLPNHQAFHNETMTDRLI